MLKKWTNAAKLYNKEAHKCRHPLASEQPRQTHVRQSTMACSGPRFSPQQNSAFAHVCADKRLSLLNFNDLQQAKWRQVKNMQSAPKGQWRGHKTVINQKKKRRELDQCVDKARIQRTKVNNLHLKRAIFFTLRSSVIMTRKGFKQRLRQTHFQKRLGQSWNGVKAGGGKLF